MEISGILMLAIALFALAVRLVAFGLALPRLRRNPSRPNHTAPPAKTPRITLLRPLKGLEYRLDETLGSSLTQDWPDYQVLFCVDDANDPAVETVRRLIAGHPGVEARILTGRETVGHNPKINNLMKGWHAADGEYVVMADSNIILPPDYLRQLFARWDKDVGLVSSPAVGVDPGNFGGALECAFLNGHQAAWQIAADQLGIGFAQGKSLFWNRAFLDAAGGPAVLGNDIAEDAASTKLVRRAGLRVRLARRPFPQPVGRRGVRAVWKRQLRWSIIRRVDFPLLFVAEPLTSAALPTVLFALGAMALGLSQWFTLLFVALWYGAEMGLTRAAGWPSGAQAFAAGLLRDAMAPALWALAWTRSSFDWQGNAVGAPTDSAAPQPKDPR